MIFSQTRTYSAPQKQKCELVASFLFPLHVPTTYNISTYIESLGRNMHAYLHS